MINKLTIRQRVLVVFLVVALSGSLLELVVAGVQIQNAIFNFHRQKLQTSALTLAVTLLEPFESYTEHRDDTEIREFLNLFQNNKTDDFVVWDSQLKSVFVLDSNILPESASDLIKDYADDFVAVDKAGHERLYVTTSITYEGRILGYVTVCQPTLSIHDEVNRRWVELAMGTLPIVIMVVMASLWLATTISNPLQVLERGALQMAKGRFDTRIELNSSDEIGQLAKSFNYMAEQVDTLVKVQRSFVSNAAHELRTPLMSLSLRIEALQGETLSKAERAVYLNDLRQELEHMTRLVTSLLNLARIDEGRIQAEHLIDDLSASLKDIARHWRIAAQKAGLSFEATIPDTLPRISIDQNQLRLICDNLLGNAVKYTPQGSIQFHVLVSVSQLKLRTIDTGIGFTTEQSEHLFDRFYRTDVARAGFSGTGLGLSIIYSLLKQIDGSIEAFSGGTNQGACFTVSIPIKKP